jgi:hypothetical protein
MPLYTTEHKRSKGADGLELIVLKAESGRWWKTGTKWGKEGESVKCECEVCGAECEAARIVGWLKVARY